MFLTIDTEIAWRHHAAGRGADDVVARSLEPAGVGIAYQLSVLSRFGLKATFFVDPMPAAIYGIAPFRALVSAILAAGQEVQLHCHPNWTGASLADRGAAARFELIEYTQAEQRALIAMARDLLVEAGAPPPVAFRAGSYAANDATLGALGELGISFDTSHNGAAHPWPSSIALAPTLISPIVHNGITEVPVTLIEDVPARFRNFQICALSAREMAAAIDHAIARDHVATTIVGHSFELANRAGTHANRVHVSRFHALCAALAARRARAPTVHFADRPRLALGRADRPLGPSVVRRTQRQAEQLWSNLIAERAA